MEQYLQSLEDRYKPNPYHNSTHAADVVQTAGVLMRAVGATLPGGRLPALERFAIVLAAATHDLAHPGVNNDFLVRTRAQEAMVYNDRSVNENMHASEAFMLAMRPGSDIFDGFSVEEYKQVILHPRYPLFVLCHCLSVPIALPLHVCSQ